MVNYIRSATKVALTVCFCIFSMLSVSADSPKSIERVKKELLKLVEVKLGTDSKLSNEVRQAKNEVNEECSDEALQEGGSLQRVICMSVHSNLVKADLYMAVKQKVVYVVDKIGADLNEPGEILNKYLDSDSKWLASIQSDCEFRSLAISQGLETTFSQKLFSSCMIDNVKERKKGLCELANTMLDEKEDCSIKKAH